MGQDHADELLCYIRNQGIGAVDADVFHGAFSVQPGTDRPVAHDPHGEEAYALHQVGDDVEGLVVGNHKLESI